MMANYIDIEITGKESCDIGRWLEKNIPNPPLPESQRWTLGYDSTGSRVGIRFIDENDSFIFMLRWA
jgi:hypothetical protein